MAYKRYVHKKGKRHGPYYYKNVRDHAGKVRTVYLGKVTTRGKRPLEAAIVFLVALLIIISALFFIQNRNLVLSRESAEKNKVPFEVDQILVKVLVKENEYVEKELRIMNVGENDVPITVEPSGVSHLADIIDKDFTIKPGQTKIVRINFTSFDKNAAVEQAPGVYIGKAIAKSGSYQKEIPVIIEIESKNVLFDMNLNPVARDRSIVQGESTTFEIRVFNLQSIESYNVEMEFLVKDTNGNTIVSEEESVVVQTQASFFKTLKIPENLKTGNYVFVAQASLGKSVGTASYLFEVESAAAREGRFNRFLGFCRNDPLCWALSVIVLLLIFSIGAYAYFFVGVLIYEKLFGASIPKRKLEEAQEAQTAEGKERNAIVQSFADFAKWAKRWKEDRLKRSLEYEKRKIRREEEEEKLKLELKQEKRRIWEEKGRLKEEEERKKAEDEEKKKQEEQRIIRQEDKARRTGLFGKCKFLIGKGYVALNKNNVWKADGIYAKLITFYSALEDESKAEIFKDVNSFYKSLLLKKSQIKAEKEENRRKAEEERKGAEERRKKEAEERKRLSKAEAERRKEQLKKSWQNAKKTGIGFLHRLGLAKTEQEKKELEKRKEEYAKRRAEEMLRAEEAQKLNQLRKMKAEGEEQRGRERARLIEEEKKKEQEQKGRQEEAERKKKEEDARKQIELEKKKAEQERRNAEEERKLALEEKRKRQELIRKQREEQARKSEEEKNRKLEEIKSSEDGLNKKDSDIAKLKAKINEERENIKSLEKDAFNIQKDMDSLRNEKGMLFKIYNDSIESRKDLSKERENKIAEWKQRHDAKISEKNQLENEAKQQYENSLKELEDELKGLSAKERAEQEKWKRLELKAKYKLGEKERENEVQAQIKELLEEKKGLEEEIREKRQSATRGVSERDILEKQKGINDHIRQHEKELEELKKKIESKESLIERHKGSIQKLEEERDKEKIELLDKKKSLGGINYLHSILKLAESIKGPIKKSLRERGKPAESERAEKDAEAGKEEKRQKGIFQIFGREKEREIAEEHIKEQEEIEKHEEKELQKSIEELEEFEQQIPKEEKKPGLIASILGRREEKYSKEEESIKRGIAIKRKGKSWKFIKCHKLLLKGEEALGKKDIANAKRLYLKARKIYISLEYHEKKDIYNELNKLYEKLSKAA